MQNVYLYTHFQVDFEITSAIPSLSRSIGGSGGGRDLYSEEDYSDFSDLSEGEQEQEPVTVAKIKHQHTEKGEPVRDLMVTTSKAPLLDVWCLMLLPFVGSCQMQKKRGQL